MANFEWRNFYHETARKLLEYKNRRDYLIKIVKDIFLENNLPLPTLDKDNHLTDIDPFTVLGLFNKHQTLPNRIKIITGFAKHLQIIAKVPDCFDGVPLLNNMNATFYGFEDDRSEHDIDNLWAFFENSLRYSDNPNKANKSSFSQYFDIIVGKKGNGTSKITMGLYWIAPETYLNLDLRSEWYIYDSGKMSPTFIATLPAKEKRISAEHYLEITQKIHELLKSGEYPLKSIPELSYAAWQYSEQVNQENKENIAQDQSDSALEENIRQTHYWTYAPGHNAERWDEFYKKRIMAIGWGEIGNLKGFQTKEEMRDKIKECFDSTKSHTNSALATWQFANEIQPGDIVFAKKGKSQLVGRGIVTSEYIYDESCPDEYKNIRKVNWTHCGEWASPGTPALKTLTDITPYTEFVNALNDVFNVEESDENAETHYQAYTDDDFRHDVFLSSQDFLCLKNLLRNKKNIILQGAPGVGKTYIARRLAYAIIGQINQERVKVIQFHQNYSYEDFIMGFRPTKTGFELRHGVFYDFCKKAENDSENDYFFIIDEINRGNTSKIFGELFMLIENDKRGEGLQLLYSNEQFSIPKNLYLIGMMNTADRSLAMIDYALRRRFSFFTVNPGFDSDGFVDYKKNINSPLFDSLVACIKDLNMEITSSLGGGFCIGHSYLCRLKSSDDIAQRLKAIVEYDILPLLEELWFDEPVQYQKWKTKLQGLFHDER